MILCLLIVGLTACRSKNITNPEMVRDQNNQQEPATSPTPPPPENPPPPPAPCTGDAECPEGQVCREGSCRLPDPPPPECTTDSDCDEDQICVEGMCAITEPDDQTAPEIVTLDPGNGSLGVSRTSSFSVTFSEPIDPTTVNATNFLVLDAEELPVSGTLTQDGSVVTFTPSTSLGMFQNYTIRLSQDLKDLAGNSLSTVPAWSFSTADGTWEAPQEIENLPTSRVASQPALAIDPERGNIVAVWRQRDGDAPTSPSSIYANHLFMDYMDESILGNFSNEPTLLDSISGHTADPQVAFDFESGNHTVVWRATSTTTSSDYNVYATAFSLSMGTWTNQMTVDLSVGTATSPTVVMDDDDNALVVWSQMNSGASRIFINELSNLFDSFSSTGPIRLSQLGTVGNASRPQIAVSESDSNALIVWEQLAGSGATLTSNLHYNVYDNSFAGAGWEIDNRTEAVTTPRIGRDVEGDAVVVWDGDGSIYSRSYTISAGGSTTWGDVASVESNTGLASQPQIAVAPSGNAIAVWRQRDDAGTAFHIYARRYQGSGWIGDRVQIDLPTGSSSNHQITMNSDGHATAVWTQAGHVYASRFFSSTGIWQTPIQLDLALTGTASDPRVVLDEENRATAIWIQSSSVYAARLE
ncbi:MAG: Ig-like domain-containing protein [Deltaproteobacteria bacterium]|nr:Ig-like domain-containing protein [Deltaproteobacteria bacterium]